MPRLHPLLLALCLLVSVSAHAAIPARSAGAITGSEFAQRTAHMTDRERQVVAVAQLLAGNVPAFLRSPVSVQIQRRLGDGQLHQAVIRVSPDYLAIGSDDDFLRIPLSLPSAIRVVEAFDAVLPTTRIVDAIQAQAVHRLRPNPLPAGAQMRSSGYLLRQHALIDAQLPGAPDGLVVGDKKDVVLTNRLFRQPGRVAIYGWHYPDGQRIQPLSLVHGANYADYSHGLRLVDEDVRIDGVSQSILDVLADSTLAPLLSSEGAIPGARDLLRPDS